MNLSIYDIENWSQNRNYYVNDIYIYNNLYYYASITHNSGSIFNSNFSTGITTFNNKTMPYFSWKPSYNSNLSIQPAVLRIKMGDGYSQNVPDGINNILLPFDLTFEKKTDTQARAIIHFLTMRKGSESFVFTPPFPFNTSKLFFCEQFSHTQVFANHHNITAKFIETPV